MDEQTSEKPINEQAWIKVWHPLGLDVRVQFTGKPVDWAGLLANVNAAFAAGWLADCPGLEEGETKEEVGYVVVRDTENKTGPGIKVDLYPVSDATKFKFLSVYLDSVEEVQAFENASGMKVAGLQKYIGSGNLERGANKQTDALIHHAPRPFTVIHKPNPAFNPEETDAKKKKPKRLFVRWGNQSAAIPQAGQPEGGDPQMTAAEIRAKEIEFAKDQARKAKLIEATIFQKFNVKSWDALTDANLQAVRNRAKEILDQQF